MENDSVGNVGHWLLMLKWHAVKRNCWKNQRCEDYYNKDPILQCKNCYNTSKKLITSFVTIGRCIYDLHTSWQHHFKSPQQATIFFSHVRPSDKNHKYHCRFTNQCLITRECENSYHSLYFDFGMLILVSVLLLSYLLELQFQGECEDIHQEILKSVWKPFLSSLKLIQ